MPSARRSRIHAAAVALCFMYYNFIRIHQTLRTTPAMAAGVATKLSEIGDILALLEVEEKRPPSTGGMLFLLARISSHFVSAYKYSFPCYRECLCLTIEKTG